MTTALCALAVGQVQPARPEFDVAAITPHPGLSNNIGIQPLPGGKLVVEFCSLRDLIRSAWAVQTWQIAGGPQWIGSDRYDIQAKAEGNPTPDAMTGPMLQALLEDRFRLVFHHETRQLPAYELTVPRAAKLRPSNGDACAPDPSRKPCGFHGFGIDGPNRRLEMTGATMAELAEVLSRSELRRTVIDKTGLAGRFDISMAWAIDGPSQDLATIFTAVQEQLGLKLEPTKGPVDVLVIDRAEKPSAN